MTREQLAQQLVTLTAALESGRVAAIRLVVVDRNLQSAHTEWCELQAAHLVGLVDNQEWCSAQLAVEGRVAAHQPWE